MTKIQIQIPAITIYRRVEGVPARVHPSPPAAPMKVAEFPKLALIHGILLRLLI